MTDTSTQAPAQDAAAAAAGQAEPAARSALEVAGTVLMAGAVLLALLLAADLFSGGRLFAQRLARPGAAEPAQEPAAAEPAEA